jgi:BASS family bile acid:Na+ symporter
MDFLYTIVIPAVLLSVMVGLGLSLTVADFKRVIAFPKAAVIGLTSQIVLLPLLAFLLALLLAPTPEIAVGAVVLAACPGGVTSNAYVFAARADLALSVTLTAVASFITVFTIPLLIYLALQVFIQQGELLDLPMLQIFRTLVMFTIIPLAVGMTCNALWPNFSQRVVERLLRRVTVGVLMFVIVTAAIASYASIRENFLQAGLLVLGLNVLSMGMGYGIARCFKLPISQVISITYEVGVQNLSLALLVTLVILDSPLLAITTLLYAVVMPVIALGFLAIARRILAADAMSRNRAADARY